MSDDEVFFGIVHLVVALVSWFWWFHRLSAVKRLGEASNIARGLLWLTFLACAAAMPVLLQYWAASDVQNSIYLLWYTVMGLAWIGIAVRFFEVVGPHSRLDVAERNNSAAGVTLAGILLGLTLAFLGGNFGEGPGWWVVVICALLSMGSLLIIWLVMACLGPQREQIVVGRDRSVAVRVACMMIGMGLILGRAVAGDWQDVNTTVVDFRAAAWPVAVMALVELGFGHATNPFSGQGRLGGLSILRGLIPGILYLAAAAAWVVHMGWW